MRLSPRSFWMLASPPTRRSTLTAFTVDGAAVGFSAHAEIDPPCPALSKGLARLLRPRGDRPQLCMFRDALGLASPPTRRSTPLPTGSQTRSRGFSAHAEIDPTPLDQEAMRSRLLRPRGDRPVSHDGMVTGFGASPPTRRSTRRRRQAIRRRRGFSAHAEIDPCLKKRIVSPSWLLRPRGDRPGVRRRRTALLTASPPTRRSTRHWGSVRICLEGFSAHAEIDPPRSFMR